MVTRCHGDHGYCRSQLLICTDVVDPDSSNGTTFLRIAPPSFDLQLWYFSVFSPSSPPNRNGEIGEIPAGRGTFEKNSKLEIRKE